MSQRMVWWRCFSGVALLGLVGVNLSEAGPSENQKVWTSSLDKTLPADYFIQGDYYGQIEGGSKLGCQVIALGQGAFQAVLYPGGLPGAGWDQKNRMVMEGKSLPVKTIFVPAKGPRTYLARSNKDFSATVEFPPKGHKPYSASIMGRKMTGRTDTGKIFNLHKTIRKSPSLGRKAPAGAIVLFNGTQLNAWQGGRLDERSKSLHTDGKDIRTEKSFNNYTMHLEFMVPFKPEGRGQGRGNSGFYQVDHYEVQILDSFGLQGRNNECGGIFNHAAPRVNMCYSPLTWQTFDIEFTNARVVKGKKVRNALITLKHNGVLVHDKVEVKGPTGGHRRDAEGTPGPIKLQGHGNPLQFRNVWILEK